MMRTLVAIADDGEFRQAVQQWFVASYQQFAQTWQDTATPQDLDYRRAWEDWLCSQGCAGLGWPHEYGGHALSLARQAMVYEALARSGAPLGVNLIGHGILAPTLLHFGSDAQKARFLPGILANTEVWCQGYSEPGAGSDLAAVRTHAEHTADGWVLHGHKIWTSFADRAQWCFVLARTDVRANRHQGLSIFLVDMRSPGVRVEPIRQINGASEFCEVFFENVRVADDLLLGSIDQGWRIAMAAASFERGTYFVPRLIRLAQELDTLRELMINQDEDRCDGSWRQRWARLVIDSDVLQLKSQRALARAIRGDPPGPEGSSTKVHWSESHQRLLELAMECLGARVCLPHDALAQDFSYAYLQSRAETILAGTSEIQRNIIAEHVLGLPKG